jgi:peptidoglycan/LPS O-acetylase OafA/YrhL
LHWLILNHAPIDDVERGWKYGIVGGAKAWMPRYNPIGFFAIFALGALASGVQVMWRRHSSYLFDGAALLSFGAVIWLMARNIGGLSEGFGLLDIPYGFPAFPLAVAIFLAVTPSSRIVGRLADNRVSRFIARISFGVYLWHFLIITLMGRFLKPSFDNGAENVWMVWLGSSAVAIIASVGAGALSFYLLEQPVVNWARGLERRRAIDKAASVPA